MNPRAAIIVWLVVLAGCAAPAQQTRYYTLSDETATLANPAGPSARYRIAIGPATVPEVLDRLQIVLRLSPNRLVISDKQLWSSALKREIPRVIAREIAQQLPAAQVAAYQQYSGQNATYRVPIDVVRFESVEGKSITLTAEWSVLSRSGELLREARSEYTEAVESPGMVPLIVAHRKALAALSQEIALAVDALAQAKN